MNKPLHEIQADFDRIALLSDEQWNHNSHYHPFLLRQLPGSCDRALEIGCGAGAFSRLLARRAEEVLALDLSPKMIELARQQSSPADNIEYRVADAMNIDLPDEAFACVVSIATLHHMPAPQAIRRMKRCLKGNGRLVILDLLRTRAPAAIFTDALAMPLNLGIRLMKTGRLRPPAAVRKAWDEHGRDEIYPTLAEVHSLCDQLLPGATVKRHLLWRYSIVWQKPL